MYDVNEDLKKAVSAFGFVLLTAGLLCRIMFEVISIGNMLRPSASILAYCGLLMVGTIGFGLILDKVSLLVTYKYHRSLRRAAWWIVDAVIILAATLLLAYDFGLIININVVDIIIVTVLILVTGYIGIQINKVIFDTLDKEVDKASVKYMKKKEESVQPED